jgi:hypothetical protein
LRTILCLVRWFLSALQCALASVRSLLLWGQHWAPRRLWLLAYQEGSEVEMGMFGFNASLSVTAMQIPYKRDVLIAPSKLTSCACPILDNTVASCQPGKLAEGNNRWHLCHHGDPSNQKRNIRPGWRRCATWFHMPRTTVSMWK